MVSPRELVCRRGYRETNPSDIAGSRAASIVVVDLRVVQSEIKRQLGTKLGITAMEGWCTINFILE